MSTEIVAPEYVMPEADAARLTNRITLIAGTIREGMEKLQGLVAEAKAGNAHVALGYPSWTAYLAATLGKEPLRLGREERQQLVGYLAGEGMSTRAIAPIVGVNQSNVARDIQVMRDASPVSGDTPALRPERAEYACEEHGVHIIDDSGDDDGFREAVEDHEAEHGEPLPPFNPATGELLDDAPEPAPKVTGLDGKTYTRPEARTPAEPRRPALAPQVESAGWDLAKAIERLQRLTADDRFDTNKNEVAPHLRSHLQNAIEVCQDLLDRINH